VSGDSAYNGVTEAELKKNRKERQRSDERETRPRQGCGEAVQTSVMMVDSGPSLAVRAMARSCGMEGEMRSAPSRPPDGATVANMGL
jgi:hypothetical protein